MYLKQKENTKRKVALFETMSWLRLWIRLDAPFSRLLKPWARANTQSTGNIVETDEVTGGAKLAWVESKAEDVVSKRAWSRLNHHI